MPSVGIDWNNDERAAYVDSSESSEVTKFYDVQISSVKSGQTITEQLTYTLKLKRSTKRSNRNKIDRDTAKDLLLQERGKSNP